MHSTGQSCNEDSSKFWEEPSPKIFEESSLQLCNRLVKADGGVSVDTEAIEHLRITRADFLHALDNDIKPALGSAQDLLEGYIYTIFLKLNIIRETF